MSSIQELINTAVKQDRGEKVQRHWYISWLGSCLTGQYLERLGRAPDAPFDDRTLRVFHCGRVFEDWIVDLLKGTGAEIETQVAVEDDLLDVSGYADLLIGNKVYEIKSKHSRAFWYMVNKEEGPNRQHEIQLWTYLSLMDLPEGRLVYVSKDDLTIAEFPVFRDDQKLNTEVADILYKLNTAWETKVPPQPVTDPKDWRFRYCSWHLQCMEFAKEKV